MGTRLSSQSNTSATVGAASVKVLSGNVERAYALLRNISDSPIWLSFGATATANNGVQLDAGNGFYEMTQQAGNVWTGEVYAISTGSGKTLLVTEGA